MKLKNIKNANYVINLWVFVFLFFLEGHEDTLTLQEKLIMDKDMDHFWFVLVHVSSWQKAFTRFGVLPPNPTCLVMGPLKRLLWTVYAFFFHELIYAFGNIAKCSV